MDRRSRIGYADELTLPGANTAVTIACVSSGIAFALDMSDAGTTR
jgi:hypothetical protein